jgi:hypothetical protein
MRNLDSNFNSKTISPRYADRLPGGEMAVTDSGLIYYAQRQSVKHNCANASIRQLSRAQGEARTPLPTTSAGDKHLTFAAWRTLRKPRHSL